MSRFRASAPADHRGLAALRLLGDRRAVATVTLNRPEKLNPLTFESYADLRDLLAELPHRGDIRVLVIRGEGKGFCGGGDVNEIIGELIQMDAAGLMGFTKMTGDVIRAMRECPIPIIAGIQGIAAGAGSVVAIAADFRIVHAPARFAFLFTKVGLSGGDMGAAYLLPRLVGSAAPPSCSCSGTRSTPRPPTATAWSPSSPTTISTVPCATLARRLADGPTLALQQTKSLITRELDMPVGPAMELDAMTQALLMTTHDHAEFHAAFNAKRPPEWTGR